MSQDNSQIQEKYTILTQSEEEFNKQMKILGSMNLDSMVELQYNEQLLKNNFRTITEILKKQFGVLNACCSNVEGLQNKPGRDKQIEQIQKEIRELKESSVDVLKESSQNKKIIDELKDNSIKPIIDQIQTQTNNFEAKISQMESIIQGISDKLNNQPVKTDFSNDISQLFTILQQLDSQLQQFYNNAINKDNGSSIDLNAVQNQIELLINMIDKLKQQMSEKVNCEDFDNIISTLKMMNNNNINTNNNNNNIQKNIEQPKSRDGNKIQVLELKIKELEDYFKNQNSQLNNLQNIFYNNQDQNQSLLSQMDKDFKSLEDRTNSLKDKLQQLQQSLNTIDENKADLIEVKKLNSDKIKKELMDIINKIKEIIMQNLNKTDQNSAEIEDLKRKVDTQNKKMTDMQKKIQQNSGSIDIQKVQEMIDNSVSELRKDLLNMINQLKDQIEKQNFEDDMLAYQQKIFQKIDEIVGALMKKLANKEDTKKALLYLEKKITELYLLINPDEKNQGELDALLVKRPLFWSCVSCDKDLDQFQGRLGDYKNWKVFPPKETSPERMGRFGVGYAQMMQNRKINIEKEKDNLNNNGVNNQQPPTNTHTHTNLPEINNNKYTPKK